MSPLWAALTASSNQPPFIFLVIGFLVGAVIFFLGFRTYRELRVVADTPLAPVRSIPMGLVHVQGKTAGDDRLTSPLTGMPCYYYKVHVEKYVKKEKDSSWETVRTDTDERAFYLDDSTAKVLVNPHGAEYDVPRTFHGEVGLHSSHSRSVDPTLGVAGPSEQDLLNYVSSASQPRAALESSNIPGASALAQVLEIEQSLEAAGIGVSLGAGGVNVGFGGDQTYRFTENCLLAERDCNILGTCVENPAPKDERDRNLIQKGQNEKTFLITSKSEKQIEKSLRWKAFLLIFVGAAIMVGMVAIMLHSAGML
jgi:hypothetical protein